MRLAARCAFSLAVLLLAASLAPIAAQAAAGGQEDWSIESAGEVGGKLQIVLRNGQVFRLPRKDFVCSYDGITLSADRLTVGWVEGSTAEEEGQKPCDPGAQYVAGGPVFWRAGRVLRAFDFVDGEILWSFIGGGDRIALHAGPTHFDYSDSCALIDIATGHALKRWSRDDKTPPPDWASVCVEN